MTHRLSDTLFSEKAAPRVAMAVAHPGDEIACAGVQLRRWRDAQVVHVTDGAPRNSVDVWRAGFVTSEGYASLRQREAIVALALAGIPVRQLHPLGFGANEASLNLSSLTETMIDKLVELQPDFVVTHAYEGGHPDRDSTVFAVHTACHVLHRELGTAPAIVEMAGCFNRAGIMATGEFLPRARLECVTRALTPADVAFKQQLLACYSYRQSALPCDGVSERFRVAPSYDFRQAPHPGKLFYELAGSGITGERWRKLAAAVRRRFASFEHTHPRSPALARAAHSSLCN